MQLRRPSRQRPTCRPYGTDGDYFSKPSVEDIVERAHAMVAEADPSSYPDLI